MEIFDAVILGAGGAGLMCALQAGRRGRRVLVLDHAEKVGGKILISGGGRCNFTNTGTSAAQFQSENEHFAKSALSRFTPENFLQMVQEHQIPFYEKKLGQLFCESSARDIVQMLTLECEKASVDLRLNHSIANVKKESDRFRVETNHGSFEAPSLVVATGGYSIPKLKATGFGFDLARQFGLRVVETAPALDGFILTDPATKIFCSLAGLSIDSIMSVHDKSFRENLLFTHVGISGPAALQASLHWRPGDEITINLLPDYDFLEGVQEHRHSRTQLKALLSQRLPARFADLFCEQKFSAIATTALAEISDKTLREVHEALHGWKLKPSSTVGYVKAEVTRGGVDTAELSSKTMESKKVPGLYFIGEVVDVTGWLGGYNFQWAWASGWCAAQVI
jgi:predicted Rossmann fold flavoprotein